MKINQISPHITVLLFLISAVSAEWNVLFRHSCGGSYEMVPNVPVGMGFNLPIIEDLFNNIGEIIWDRASCQCPQLNRTEFMLHFDPMTALLNAFEGKETTVIPRSDCRFATSLLQLSDLADFTFSDPNFNRACNVRKWLKDGECSFAIPGNELGFTINVNLWRCPKRYVGIPGFQLSCSGPGCRTLAIPCSEDSQCNSGQMCMKLVSDFRTQQQILKQYILPIFGPAAGSCYIKPENNILSAALTHIRSYFDKNKVSLVGFCGIQEIIMGRLSSFSPNALSLSQIQGDSQSNCILRGAPINDITMNNLVGSTVVVQNKSDITIRFGNWTTRNPPILEWTCNTQLKIYENVFGWGMAPQFNKLITTFTTYMYNIANCALRTKLTQEQFLVRFGLWSPSFWLHYFDASVDSSTIDLGKDGYDFRQLFGTIAKIVFPDSCSYETWYRTGKCSLEYDGLSSLFDLDLRLGLSLKRCPKVDTLRARPPLPEIELECFGTDCNLFTSYRYFCKSDADCKSRGKCLNLISLITNSVGMSDMFEYLDLTAWIMPAEGPTSPNNVCEVFSSFPASDLQCGGIIKFHSDLRKILSSLGYISAPGSSDTTSSNICIPELSVASEKAYIWGMTQMIINYVLQLEFPGLKNWTWRDK